MNYNITEKWRLLSAAFFCLIVVVSCNKVDSPIGDELIAEYDLLSSGGIDTFYLQTFSIKEDSTITDNPNLAQLGSYQDPIFGNYKAEFYTQVVLSGLNPAFGDLSTISIDSFVLALEYAGFYGEPGNQTVEVFELDDTLSINSVYYQFSSKPLKSTNWVVPGTESLMFDEDFFTVVGTDTLAPQLRIQLDTNIARQIMSDAAVFTAEFADNSLFVQNYLKGLCVRTNNGIQSSKQGGVAYFDLNDQNSKITIFYTENGTQKTFDLNINSTCADFNRIQTNLTGTRVEQVINDTVSGQTEFYAQANSVRAVVNMPTLKSLPKKAVVHKATLYLPVQYQLSSNFSPGSSVVALTNQEGTFIATGSYSSTFKHFAIDITNFAQAIAIGEQTSTDLVISPATFISSANRIVFNGLNTTNKMRPKVVVTYTEF